MTYISVIETPEGCFLRIAKPDSKPEDYPLSVERRAAIAAACCASVQAEIQRAKVRVESREREWHTRDIAVS